MATIGDAILGAINTNWAVPTGGVKPTLANTEDVRFDYPDVTEIVIALSYTLYTRVERVNDTYVDRFHTITLQAQTTDATDMEERLHEIVDEVDRILNTNGVTGFTTVKMMKKDYTPSDRSRGIYAANLHIELIERNTSAATAAGSTTASTLTVDTLTVNTSIAGSPTAALGATTVAGNITVTGTVDGVDIAGDVLIHADVDDTPVNGETTVPVSSNWAFDHITDSAAHTNIGIDDLDDTTLTGAYLEDLLMFGSANAAWCPTIPVGNSDAETIDVDGNMFSQGAGADRYWLFVLPQPTNKGGLKLYVKGTRTGVSDGDANNYINNIYLIGAKYDGATTVDTNADDIGEGGAEIDTDTYGPYDMSSYEQVQLVVHTEANAANALDISSIELHCYYAT
jgi:hypothetical protein